MNFVSSFTVVIVNDSEVMMHGFFGLFISPFVIKLHYSFVGKM